MIEIDDVDESSDEEGNKVSKSKFSHCMNFFFIYSLEILRRLVCSILSITTSSSHLLSNL